MAIQLNQVTDTFTATTGTITFSGQKSLGAQNTITITGGSSGQALTTNGSGVLSWTTVATGSGLSGSAITADFGPGSSGYLTTTYALPTVAAGQAYSVIITGNTSSTGATFVLRVGSAGTTSDTAILTFSPDYTATVGTDYRVEFILTFRTSTSAIASATFSSIESSVGGVSSFDAATSSVVTSLTTTYLGVSASNTNVGTVYQAVINRII